MKFMITAMLFLHITILLLFNRETILLAFAKLKANQIGSDIIMLINSTAKYYLKSYYFDKYYVKIIHICIILIHCLFSLLYRACMFAYRLQR